MSNKRCSTNSQAAPESDAWILHRDFADAAVVEALFRYRTAGSLSRRKHYAQVLDLLGGSHMIGLEVTACDMAEAFLAHVDEPALLVAMRVDSAENYGLQAFWQQVLNEIEAATRPPRIIDQE